MAFTQYFNLYINNDDTEKVSSWFEQMAGPNNSNMIKLDTILKSFREDIENMSSSNGTLTIARTAAAMTDSSRIYIYAGSESGYIEGNWYYYNGSQWVSGGNWGGVNADDTLSIEGMAADAKKTGTEINKIKDQLDDLMIFTPGSDNLLNTDNFVYGYYSSGQWTDSETYITSDYMNVSGASTIYIHRFNLNNGDKQDTAKLFQYIYWFDENKNYLNRTAYTTGTVSYSVYNGAIYARLMGSASSINGNLADNKGYSFSLKELDNYVAYTDGSYELNLVSVNRQFETVNRLISTTTVSKTGDLLEIKTPKARYIFKLVTKASHNLDTWRLYQGDLITADGSYFNMWTDSDAEGAIRINGEPDYVSGYHGSETMNAGTLHVFLDGAELDMTENLPETVFSNLTIYLQSTVNHCYASSDNYQIAFIRDKKLVFEGGKVTVSNHYVAQQNLTISAAKLALFQIYKYDANNNPVFTYYSVNTDNKCYAVADVETSQPTASENMNSADIQTKYACIHFKSLATSGQNYKGYITNFDTQRRIKFYFDTIYSTTNISTGDVLSSEFSWEVR